MTATVGDEVLSPGMVDEEVRPRRWLGRLSVRTAVTPFVLAVAVVVVWNFAQSRVGSFDRAQVEGIMNHASMRSRVWEHTKLSAASTLLALAVALPSGIAMTRGRLRRTSQALLWVATAGQTIPTVSVLAIVFTFMSLGFAPALIALWIYSILPILQNTVVGIRSVDPDIVESARGMGMSSAGVLFKIELPLALPVIVAGVRTAVVLNVGTAALASFVGAGGLGQVIDTGITNLNTPLLYVGAGFTAILALAFDWFVALVGELLTPVRAA